MFFESKSVDRIAETPSGEPLGEGGLDAGAIKLSNSEAHHALQANPSPIPGSQGIRGTLVESTSNTLEAGPGHPVKCWIYTRVQDWHEVGHQTVATCDVTLECFAKHHNMLF